jgi:L-seryl-tRNA(Ser) seleniumtransferase
MDNTKLSKLPQIAILLENSDIKPWFTKLSRPIVSRLTSKTVNCIREEVKNGEPFPAVSDIIARISSECRKVYRQRIQRVINGTGIILHTNMGRSPIAGETWQEVKDINVSYSNLELDLNTGKRGKRNGLIPLLVSEFLGTESALVVNNNAAAVFLILSVFAKGKEVIVSRGEQVQIGGGFRIPEILAASGAALVEIGTTNITTIQDYKNALTEDTAMVLSVHRSNFKLEGFTESPKIGEIKSILPRKVLLVSDQGSGNIDEDIPGEQKAGSILKQGADLICFSGDKLIGGPQCGIIAGKGNLIKKLERHQLMRIFRPGKTIYSLMEEVLITRLNGYWEGHTQQVLKTPLEELKKCAQKLSRNIDKDLVRIIDSKSSTGGGSAPGEYFQSLSIELLFNETPDKLLHRLRNSEPPIIGTIHAGKVRLNLATLLEMDIPVVRARLIELAKEYQS